MNEDSLAYNCEYSKTVREDLKRALEGGVHRGLLISAHASAISILISALPEEDADKILGAVKVGSDATRSFFSSEGSPDDLQDAKEAVDQGLRHIKIGD